MGRIALGRSSCSFATDETLLEAAEGAKALHWCSRLALLAGVLACISQFQAADLDMWHEMALFREAVRTGRIPTEDVFAYTQTVSPVVHHEWGTGGVLYLIAVPSGLGGAGILALKYSLAAVIAVGCWTCARRRGASEAVLSFLAGIAIGLGWVGFGTVRAGLFTLACLVAELHLLEEDRRGRRWWIAAWLPLYVLWLNLHAGFLAGAGLFGVHALERFARSYGRHRRLAAACGETWHLFATGLAMLPLILVNPYGWDYTQFLVHAVSLERPEIVEWRSLTDLTGDGWLIGIFVLSIAVGGYAAVRRGWLRLEGLPLVLTAAVPAVQHVRHLPLYAVVWLCFVPAWFEGTGVGRDVKRCWSRCGRTIAVLWLVCACLATVCTIRSRFWELQVPANEPVNGLLYPGGAVEYLKETGFRGNLMVPFEIGSFVSWKLHPAVKVSIDSRYEVAYPPEALQDNTAFYGARDGWQERLFRAAADAVLVPRHSPVAEPLERAARPEWRCVYRDDLFLLFVRAERATALPRIDRSGETITATFP